MCMRSAHCILKSLSDQLVYVTKQKLKCAIASMRTNCASIRICNAECRSAAFLDTHRKIVNYMVVLMSHVMLQEMIVYKSLRGYYYFSSGWRKSIAAKQLISQCVAVLNKVSYDALSRCGRNKASFSRCVGLGRIYFWWFIMPWFCVYGRQFERCSRLHGRRGRCDCIQHVRLSLFRMVKQHTCCGSSAIIAPEA